ncbi:DNA-binding CsgD family transcriptional regulator/tetratricopeptide (TPR) repeat protein [Saccharopolyspora lacisalsi]|uniref:DNA-binding CsgD family transcriptional regulator/tetratricopeptide (TPR) repeat protein n=1 Tax=Halosaccharopolyspora lacisalsi TaxID=1000566 RepID=A0A839E4D0_9PSEU|nr:DNA-binding CsgD family transcriptional regulator/tetratricopeptide (TPR) repeat protein [Halosaccharopolyspora lacisalsi]
MRAGEPRLTLLAGEAGLGRSTVLEAIADKLTGTGTRVLTVRLSENDTAGHYGLLYRLLAELELSEEHPPSATTSENSALGLVARLSADDHDPSSSTASAQLAGIVSSAVRRHLPLTVLVDDAQWADIGTVSLLDQFIRRFAGPGFTVVATWRCWPPTGPDDHQRATTMHRLVAGGAARVITMRPLARAETTALIAASVRAVPDSELVDRLHTDSRGNPAALNSEIEAQLESGALRVVDRHAYSQRTLDPLPLSEQHPLLAAIRDSGALCWSVARTMTVLAPLGDAAAGLVAEALEIDPTVAHASLRSLETGRVLVGSSKAGWKFRAPVVRQALEASLGPYEQQRLCALAVRAVWDGVAEPADETFLPDQLVAAGRLVDPERSTDELLAGSEAVMFTDGARAVRWLRALVDRVHEPDKRSMALLSHSAACAIHNRLEESVDSARAVLVEYAERLSAETLQETELVYVLSLAACGQWSELNRLAAREISLSGGPANELVTRAFALLFLGRYTDGDELLREHQRSWTTANPVTADLGHIYRGGAGVLTGDPSLLRRFLADPRSWRSRDHPRHRFEQIRYEVDMLLMLGERDEATRVLRANDVSVEQLHNTERSLLRLLRGEHSAALDMARRSIAEGGYSTRPLVPVVMARGAAGVLIGRGWLTRARELTDMARGMHLDHLLDHADVRCLRALGEPENADELLRSALHSADENGFVLGTEHMWADLAVREHALGNHEQAVRCVHRAQGVAEALGTHRAKLTYLVSRARVHGDRAAGRTAVRRARERAIPDESAWVFTSVALCGIDTKRLLSDAYVLLGELDALLWRAQLRGIMRAHHVPVPGRSITTAENERLLAVLVTEGLTNRQLALLFGTSEKSVESRLNRMFARTGHRSRVELAAAMLTDEYRG